MKCLSHRQALVLSLFLLLFLVYFSPPASYSYAQSTPDPQKIDLTLYYESLCPYCSYFIAHDLVRLFTDGLISIVNLRLVPWGNSAVDASGYFQCQHGTGECLLNTVEACAIYVYPDPYKHYFFIQCIEALAYQGKEAEWQSCFAETSLEPQPLFDCYNQGIGRRLELQYAYETTQLNPPHLYVPWVLVNNQPLHGDYQNFIPYICRAYKGSSVPILCNSIQFEINSFKEEKIDATKQGCFEGEQKNLTLFEPTKIPHQSMRVFIGGSNKR